MIIDSSNSVEGSMPDFEGAAACGKCSSYASYDCNNGPCVDNGLARLNVGLHLSEPTSLLYEYAARYWLQRCTIPSPVVFCPPRILEDR